MSGETSKVCLKNLGPRGTTMNFPSYTAPLRTKTKKTPKIRIAKNKSFTERLNVDGFSKKPLHLLSPGLDRHIEHFLTKFNH